MVVSFNIFLFLILNKARPEPPPPYLRDEKMAIKKYLRILWQRSSHVMERIRIKNTI
jgi:hypothetical protein